MILFLDDDPNRAALAFQRFTPERRANTIWCKTAAEAIMTLEAFDLDEAYLDHDLGGVLYQDSRADNCGMEVVRWLEKHPELAAKWEHTQFTVHSHNFPAARLMVQRMRDLGLNVKYWPFGFGSEVRL